MKPTLSMPSEIVVPSVVPEAPQLQTDLNRATDGLLRFAEQANRLFETKPDIRRRLVLSGTVGAKYDEITRVAPVLQETVVTIQLPSPRTQDGGRAVYLVRANTRGDIVVRPIGCLVNGRGLYRMLGCVGMVEFRFDGANFWASHPGYRDWGDEA